MLRPPVRPDDEARLVRLVPQTHHHRSSSSSSSCWPSAAAQVEMFRVEELRPVQCSSPTSPTIRPVPCLALPLLPPGLPRREEEEGEGRGPGQHLLQPQLDLGLELDLVERPHAASLVLQPAGLDPLEQLQELLGVFRRGFRLQGQDGERGSPGGNQHSDLTILLLLQPGSLLQQYMCLYPFLSVNPVLCHRRSRECCNVFYLLCQPHCTVTRTTQHLTRALYVGCCHHTILSVGPERGGIFTSINNILYSTYNIYHNNLTYRHFPLNLTFPNDSVFSTSYQIETREPGHPASCSGFVKRFMCCELLCHCLCHC